MADSFHFSVNIISRGKGKSAVASAAYISGEKIKNEWDGVTHDYTRKERTHRLITRGAILESLIENAEELTDEEIKILLEEATKTKEFKETLKIMRAN